MEKLLSQIYQILQKLIGQHRQLLDVIRAEREALVEANVKLIQDTAAIKQNIIEAIHQTESLRVKSMVQLGMDLKRPFRELTLSAIILEIQGREPKIAEQFQTVFNVLNILIQRISEQNQNNRTLIERSLEHVHKMKKNVLGEASQKAATYSQQGQRVSVPQTAKLLSKEV